MFAVIDVETTGGKPGQDRITEIAIIVHNGKRIVESFSSLVNPERPIDPYVVGLTGISDDMVASAPRFPEIVDRVQQLTEGMIFVAHNAPFDYRLVREEFKRAGKSFQRKKLCTVRMSQKIFPDAKGYSLGVITKEMGIVLDNAHRAFGDAEATALLLEKLIFNDRKEIISKALEDGLSESSLPPNLPKNEVDSLPEEPGVYYFLDSRHKPLYIGMSKDIRTRVISHFSSDLNSRSGSELFQKVHHISFEVTGDELIAQLLESKEIKRFMPPYNKAQRRKKYRYGVFREKDDDGFENLHVHLLNAERKAIIKASTRKGAERALERLASKHDLYHHLALIPQYKKMSSADEFKELISKHIDRAIGEYSYRHPSFILIGKGLEPDTRSAVWIQDGVYKGFGYFDPKYVDNGVESLQACVKKFEDDPDIHRIIRAWLRKKKNAEVIRLTN